MDWLVAQVLDPNLSAPVVIGLMAVAAIVLTEGISNSAAVAILLPIGYSVGDVAGVGPALMTLVVTIPAGLAFLFPISSPPNAISFSAGHYNVREVVQIGWPMTVAAFVTLAVVIPLWWGWVLNVNAW